MVVLLGLWITHARLGNAEEAENFQRRFEECQNAQKQYNSLLNEEDLSKEEKAFNVSQRLHQLKKLINVSDMAEPAQCTWRKIGDKRCVSGRKKGVVDINP